MITVQGCRTQAWRVIVLAVAVATSASLAQSPESVADRQREIIEQIEREEALNGPRSEALIEPLTALVLSYQDSGDNTLAAAMIERLQQVMRENYGLHTLEQAPLIRQLIAHEESVGNFETAWRLEQDLLMLARRHPEDLRIVPILHELADKRIDILESYDAGGFPPQIVLGCYFDASDYDGKTSCFSGSRRVLVRALHSEAEANYLEAIELLRRNGQYSSEELRELEMKVVRNRYAWGASLHGYEVGRASLERIVQYEIESAAPAVRRVSALVQLADWDLMFSEGRSELESVLEQYVQAHREAQRDGVAQAELDRLFSPATPVLLPSFLPNPLSLDGTGDETGYIDIAFELTKYGEPENVEILDATDDVTRVERNGLVRLVKRSRFRPIMTNGELTDSVAVVTRYYVDGVED